MKLATLFDGTRDGELVIVSKDLTRFAEAPASLSTLQEALDRWDVVEPMLQRIYKDVENSTIQTYRLDQSNCMSPLPRAYQWLDGSSYVNHVELVRKSRGAEMPETFWTDPLMYQGSSDNFIGPYENINLPDETWGIDLEAEFAVITDDVKMGTTADKTNDHIKLVMLVNDVSLRNLIPNELSKGFGFVQSKAQTSFSPIAVTLDELTEYTDDRMNYTMSVNINDEPYGRTNMANDMVFGMNELIEHASKTRNLTAGTIIGSGTISNKDVDGGPGDPVRHGGLGYSCIAEERMVETIETGSAKTSFLTSGDKVEIEVKDKNGNSIFGKISQHVNHKFYD